VDEGKSSRIGGVPCDRASGGRQGKWGKTRGDRLVWISVGVKFRVCDLVVSCKHFLQLAAAKAISSSEEATGTPSDDVLLPVRARERGVGGEGERG
jgi:hypothetical protein